MDSDVLDVDTARRRTVDLTDAVRLLGTWQSVVLVDLNRDNPRRSVRLSFLGGRANPGGPVM
ncbi:YjbQ family protein [Candidatus Mycolicibacterium alkanivorans]|uniref:YjbQ family protein n=1 Tax=Candidatus Mycolicibacterium alkanivorans TaxID=2954114 RepID=A0ABS9YY54_9MYCO|nr:YjbQ family protein [Candidatus Mycolicibacterium alkanivorans]MCI4676156.1 YjbQ family protein [Candidatus Mycolicibacterium alkanivorans]